MKAEDTRSPSQFSEDKSDGVATVRVYGSLVRDAHGKKLSSLDVETPMKVEELLKTLGKLHGLALQRENTLILVNGIEANVLDDLDTLIRAGDEVSLVPMIHGGCGP
jgi:molybdopterin converting factor small subunit